MIIQSKNVWIDEAFIPAQIELADEKIKGIYGYGEKAVDKDFGEQRILPGLIDVHCHGYNGMDCGHATKPGLEDWIAALPQEGVTSFMATTATTMEESLIRSHAIIADLIENPPKGARIIGTHVEGPQINHDRRGAHNPYYIQKPDIEQFKRYQSAARGHIKMICIATEQDDDFALTRYCTENGVRVVIGHTVSLYDACWAAKEAGASSFTHIFNAMIGLHHREPGTAGAALTMDDMYAELICDGVHVNFEVAKIVVRCKPKDKLLLITDSVQLKGYPPGEYNENGRKIRITEEGSAYLESGTLCGSSAKMINLVRDCITIVGAPLEKAINAATINPATFLGIGDRKGLLKEGYDADVIVIDDDYKVQQTYVLGEAQL